MKIDYTLNILKEKVQYSPRLEFINPIINSKSKIFEIAGDNSYGKTFLLRLISYAFMADKLPTEVLLDSLRESITCYDDKEKYDLTYEIEFLLNENLKLKLWKESGRERLITIGDSPPLSYKNIHKDFNVVYDVPLNPNERLKGVISDLKIWNENIYKKLDRYINILRISINDFDNIRDDLKIDELNKELKLLDTEIADREDNYEKLLKTKELLEGYISIKDLCVNYQNQLLKTSQFGKMQTAFKKLKKPNKILKKDESVILNLSGKLNNLKDDFRTIIKDFIIELNKHNKIKEIIENDYSLNEYYNQLKSTEFETFVSPTDSEFERIYSRINEIKSKITNFVDNEETGKSHKINHVLQELLKQIDEIILVGAEDILNEITRIDSKFLKSEISKRLAQYSISDYKSVKFFFGSDISTKIRSVVENARKVKREIEKENSKLSIDDDGDKYYAAKAEIDRTKSEIERNNSTITQLKYNITQKIKNFKEENMNDYDKANNLLSITKMQISNNSYTDNPQKAISEINSTLSNYQNKIREFNRQKLLAASRLEIESRKKIGTFTEYQKEKYRLLLKRIIGMRKTVNSYQTIIENIINLSYESTNINNQDFIKVAGSVIAHSLDYKILRSNGEYIKLFYYDLIERDFHCENEIIINVSEISTGLASGNYLKQRIQNVEGKYVIILLDEIGNMDQNTLKEVIKSIKVLEDQNRLLLAILTRPSTGELKVIEH
jgi:hypothetical protein